jgi:hypothetical protein
VDTISDMDANTNTNKNVNIYSISDAYSRTRWTAVSRNAGDWFHWCAGIWGNSTCM